MDLVEKILHKKQLYKGRYLKSIEEWKVSLPDGRISKREVVFAPDAVAILPISENNQVYMVKQFRPSVGKVTIEIPAGIIDEGEKPEETAKRELREETGIICDEVHWITSYYPAVGFATCKIDLFYADRFKDIQQTDLDQDEFIEIVSYPLEEVLAMIKQNEIYDGKSKVAILHYNYLIKNSLS